MIDLKKTQNSLQYEITYVRKDIANTLFSTLDVMFNDKKIGIITHEIYRQDVGAAYVFTSWSNDFFIQSCEHRSLVKLQERIQFVIDNVINNVRHLFDITLPSPEPTTDDFVHPNAKIPKEFIPKED
jgi:hypothetical protein